MERHYVFIATFVLILHILQAQDQTGFINVDCGLPLSESSYKEAYTGLIYTSDANLITSGEIGKIAREFELRRAKQMYTMRYFPKGVRNCYNLNVTRDTNYLIRVGFLYGNYDGLRVVPEFDVYLGPNFWRTINSNDTMDELIHVTKSDFLQVCLIKTGITIPFMNVLELRPTIKNAYVTQSGSLKLLFRKSLTTSNRIIRYPNDAYDRIWWPMFKESLWTQVTTSLNLTSRNDFELPQIVMTRGVTPLNANATIDISWTLKPPTTQYHFYMHFVELQNLRANETREMDIAVNGNLMYTAYIPKFLKPETMFDITPKKCAGGSCLLKLSKTPKSTLPPLLNAFEVFTVIDFPQKETNEIDVYGIKNVQDTYALSRISWQGDPCVPKKFMWDGLTCDDSDTSLPPIITSLDLSSSRLSGTIAEAIQNLTHNEKLDLSNNNLTGDIPEFLVDIKSLLVINLSGNNFTGSVPLSLLQKRRMELSVDNNPYLLCTTGSCMMGKGVDGHEKKRITVTVVASIASMTIFVGAFVMFLVLKKKKASKAKGSRKIITKNRRFTYSEVVKITNNFERVLGKGGFEMGYHGFVNSSEQVAVKMLSHSSSQGYKQFKAEVELLLRVHHKNLVGLVGYCEEGENLALIYEYMSNGDLKEHMLGLEYFHNGCKPPIVHRDVKTTNILLNEHFEAKIADFGLSRSFPIEGETQESTNVVGTLGYLDPEYHRTNGLTYKSDVYSFGIVLLEMVTNQHVIDQSREKRHIGEWVGSVLTNGDIVSIMDPSLKGDYDSGSVWKVTELAMSCLNPSSTKRPTMSQVVIELKECLASENARRGASRDMDSKSSIEVSMTFDTDVSPTAW